MQVIIFKAENGHAAVVHVAPEFADQAALVAAKDVPAGADWRLVDAADLPELAAGLHLIWSDKGPLTADKGPVMALSREAFCVALIGAGILTEVEATDAALGAWPPKFEPALAGKSLVEKLTIKNLWRETKAVARDAPMFLDLLAFYAAAKGLGAAQAQALGDAIFAKG